jgi:hypothetical protein
VSTADTALFIADNVHKIALREDAGTFLNDVLRMRDDIERMINRSELMRWLGPCPTRRSDTDDACGFELRCKPEDVEVYCPRCRCIHNPDRLQLIMMNDLQYKKLTINKILEINKMQPEEFQVSERTIRDWRQKEKLLPCAWLHLEGDEKVELGAPAADEDKPLFLWSDVQKLRAKKDEKRRRHVA